MATRYYLVVQYHPNLPPTHGKVEDAFLYNTQSGVELPQYSIRVTYQEYLAHQVGSLWKTRPDPYWPEDQEISPVIPDAIPPSVLPLARNGVKNFDKTSDGGLVIQLEDGRLFGVTLDNQTITSASLEPDGTLKLYTGGSSVTATGNTFGVSGFEATDGRLVITRVDSSVLAVDPTGAKITTVKDVPVPAGSTLAVDFVAERSVKYVVLVEDRNLATRLSFEILATNQFGNSVEYTVYSRVGNVGAQVRVEALLLDGGVSLSVTNNELNTQFVSFTRSIL